MEFLILLITPLVAALLCIAVRERRWIIEAVTLLAAAIEATTATMLVGNVIARGSYVSGAYFALDALSAVFLSIVTLVGCAAAVHAVGYLRAETQKEVIGFRRVRQFYALFHLFLMSMFAAVVVTHPVLMWVAVEATTLSTAFLISFYHKPTATEAAWKYLIINSTGLLIAFLGVLLFVASGATFGNVWLYGNGIVPDPMLLKIAFVFVLIGFGTKAGFAPMHTWLPDAHSKAPVPISGLLSGVLLNVAFYAIVRFKVLADGALGAAFSQHLLLAFGLLSVVVASLLIFTQRNYKRLLAYSSIEHMGLMAIGFAVGGVGIFAALLHAVYHAITKSLLFLSAGNIFVKFSTTKIAGVRGMGAVLPVTAIVFFAGVLAITGVPPFGIFVTEFSIVAATMAAHPYAVIVLLAALALAFIGFLKHASGMVMGDASEGIPKGEANAWTVLPVVALAALLLALSVHIPAAMHTLLTTAANLAS